MSGTESGLMVLLGFGRKYFPNRPPPAAPRRGAAAGEGGGTVRRAGEGGRGKKGGGVIRRGGGEVAPDNGAFRMLCEIVQADYANMCPSSLSRLRFFNSRSLGSLFLNENIDNI